MAPPDNPTTCNHYYVDEAGDTALFNKRGRVIIGKEGVSRLFMVGVAKVSDPLTATGLLNDLRSSLLADPYFKDVPSMSPERRKTALLFHAKDDLPEVRREVFKILTGLDIKVFVAIKRKEYLANTARLLMARGQKLRPDDVYDNLVKRLFRNLLHKADFNLITFARRGKSARQHALENAIKRAQHNFERSTGIPSNSLVKIIPSTPSQYVGLQIIDYYLWALQRMLEKGEDRFFELLKPAYRLIMDLDDTRNREYGEWYSDGNPLSLEKVKPVIG